MFHFVLMCVTMLYCLSGETSVFRIQLVFWLGLVGKGMLRFNGCTYTEE